MQSNDHISHPRRWGHNRWKFAEILGASDDDIDFIYAIDESNHSVVFLYGNCRGIAFTGLGGLL
jgi:hypothetical protein